MRPLTLGTQFLLLFILLTSCRKDNGESVLPDAFPFSRDSEYIAVFGDIQYYTNYKYDDLFKYSVDWIEKAYDDGYKILGVLHTGDITQSNDTKSEWQHFDNAMKGFSAKIPFISLIGDHDYSWEGGLIYDRDSTHFTEHVSFPLVTSRIVAAYESGRMENIIVRNYIHGRRYDFILLEFGPRKEVVDWANEWVQSHPEIQFILMNHEYLENGGGRRTSGLKCKIRLRNTSYTTPEELWNELIKCNDNIVCVLCGHVGGLYALTIDTNEYGREIPQIQHNIQGSEYRYDNWLMLWEFPKDCNSVNFFIYNTKTEQYYNNQKVLFTFKY